jgi:hypothetical protein
MIVRSVLAHLAVLLLSLAALPVFADAQPRRKESGVFVAEDPRPVVIRLTEGVQDPEYVSAMGGGLLEWLVADSISRSLDSRRSERHRGDFEALDAAATPEWVAEQLLQAVRQGLSDVEGVDVSNIILENRQVASPDTREPGDALYLSLSYQFTPLFREFRVTLSAEVIGQDAKGKPFHRFNQRLYYEVPAARLAGITKLAERNMQFWRADEGRAVRDTLAAAPAALVEMLAFDIPQTVRLGRIRGKQTYFLDPGQVSTYWVAIHEAESRQWLRLRNGYLVNLPLSD